LSKLSRLIWKLILTKRVIAFLDNRSFPGSNNRVSIYAVLEFFIRWVDNRDIRIRSSALSFTFLLALFPTVIFIFTLIAYLPISQNAQDVLSFMENILPQQAYTSIESTLADILKNQRGGLLSFGFMMAMYFSTNGFVTLMNLLDKYDVSKRSKRSFWKKRIVALILAVLVFISLLISVLVLTVGKYITQWLQQLNYFPNKLANWGFTSLNYLLVIVIVLFIVSAIYFMAPSRTRNWRFLSPGSIFASSIIVITTVLFSAYVNAFNTYNKLYGSIGVLIFIMLLIYVSTYILLLGYELNVAIDKTIEQVSKDKPIKANRIIMLRKESLEGEEME
jgi:membrane protein